MPNTTNFNWPTPADTDLVKDGAAAIRNLGDGVDTSLVDLKGGTTGQILSKASNADMDFAFITPNVGDLTEVQAGTGISVADGTGPIPIVTNTVATEFDAKGDLVVGTGSDTFDRLAVGTDGYTLVADSVEATGLKWAAPASGSTFVGCALYKSGNQTISNSANNTLTWDSEHFDTDTFHSTVTNTDRITIPSGKDGYYLFTASVRFNANGTGRRYIELFKNGSASGTAVMETQPGQYNSNTLAFVVSAVATDYFTLDAYQSSGGNLDVLGAISNGTFFGCTYLGA
jgi:hypothetical protein